MTDIIGKNFGRYKILEPLGEGGMAAVYKGYDDRLHREVAVKIIKVPQVGENRFLTRFEREAEALAQLSHPNIVDIYDYGEERGLPYLVMEHLSGGTLKQKLGKPMNLQDAAAVVLPIAKALAYAHSQGILHRDVKPSNILVRQNGDPVLTDFGIASRIESQHTLTGTGLGIGTPEYMSPEQGLGKKLDGRTDLYSLGVVLYELVTGKKPFEGATPGEIAIKQNTETAMRPSKILADLDDMTDRIILKALERNPDHRYADMQAFVEVLEGLIQGQPEERFQGIQLQQIPDSHNRGDELTVDALQTASEGLRTSKQGRGRAGFIVAGLLLIGMIALGAWKFWPANPPAPTVAAIVMSTVTPEEVNKPTRLPSPTVTATFTPTTEPTPEVITIDNVNRLAEIMTLEIEADHYISSIAFSPDTFFLAAGDGSGTVIVYDLASGEIVQTFEGHTDSVSAVSFSPDGTLIASSSYDGTVRLWLIENGRQIGEFHGHNGRVFDVKFTPDGAMVASSGMEGTVRFWDIGSGKNIKTFLDKTFGWGLVTSFDFSPQGDKLVNSRFQIWDVNSGSLERRIEVIHQMPVGVAIYSPNGEFIAGSSSYGYFEDSKETIQVWSTVNGQEELRITDFGLYFVNHIFFSADGKMLIVGGADEINVTDDGEISIISNKLLFIDSLSGEVLDTKPVEYVFTMSPDGTLLADAGEKITIYAVR